MTLPDLSDTELREELARAAYYRERYEDVCVDRESELDENAAYFCLQWETLSEGAQRPYRSGVARALDHVEELVSVA